MNRLLGLMVLFPGAVAMAADIVVTPNGPSLAEAVVQSRTLPAGPKRILLAGGVHRVPTTVTLTAADDGLTIEAAPGARPTLLGGRRVTGWQPISDGLLAADLPEVAAGAWDFRMLVVNGRRADRARLPATGRFEHLDTWTVPWMSTTGGGWKTKPTPEQLTHLTYRPEDLGAWLEPHNAEVTVYHQWDESVVGVADVDEVNHRLRFSSPLGHPPGAFGVKGYVVWNVREGLTRPGQWYLDRAAGRVVYWPRDGEDANNLAVEAPTTETILAIRGTAEQPASQITIRGLRFELTNTPLVAGGFGAGRFAGAVEVTQASGVVLEKLTIERVNGQGIKAWKVPGLAVRGCVTTDIGACGVRASEGGGTIEDCVVSHIGRSYPSAIGLSAGGRDGAWRIAHNLIHDTPYSGMSCGGDDHVIEANRIHHVMQELHDGGGIYITFCKRIRLAGNWLHDIAPEGRSQTNAYYLDEQAEDCVVEGNLSVGAATPLLCHMAKNNTVRGNVFLNDGELVLSLPKSEGFGFARNVLVAGGRILFRNPAAVVSTEGDWYFSRGGQYLGLPLVNYSSKDPLPLDLPGEVRYADPQLRSGTDGKVVFGAGPAGLDVSTAGPREQ